jgi:hypothetical protein
MDFFNYRLWKSGRRVVDFFNSRLTNKQLIFYLLNLLYTNISRSLLMNSAFNIKTFCFELEDKKQPP